MRFLAFVIAFISLIGLLLLWGQVNLALHLDSHTNSLAGFAIGGIGIIIYLVLEDKLTK